MFDKRNKLSDLVASDVRAHFGEKVYETVIPRNVRISEAPSHGRPVLIYDFGCVRARRLTCIWPAKCCDASGRSPDVVGPETTWVSGPRRCSAKTASSTAPNRKARRARCRSNICGRAGFSRDGRFARRICELAQSIAEKGVLQPILARRDPEQPNGFEIIAGERRWRAAQLAQLHELPVIVRGYRPGALEIALIENLQRQDLAVGRSRGLSSGCWTNTRIPRRTWRRQSAEPRPRRQYDALAGAPLRSSS